MSTRQNLLNSSSTTTTSTSSKITAKNRNRSNNQNKYGIGGNTSRTIKNSFNTNIMHDKRIKRGSTCVIRNSIQNRFNSNSLKTKKNSTFSQKTQKLKKSKKRRNTTSAKNIDPVHGRQHMQCQTDTYIEKIYTHPNINSMSTQTETYLDRPSTPLFIQKTSGISIATQIEYKYIFNFDQEIEPVLEVLVNKTIEQSLMEVLEEQELKAIEMKQLLFEQKCNLKINEIQRFEEKERRLNIEKERRIKQRYEQKLLEDHKMRKIEAQKIATQVIENIEQKVMDELENSGYFYDPIVREIETIFMPKLLKNVSLKVQQMQTYVACVDDILVNIVSEMISIMKTSICEFDEKKKMEEEERRLKDLLNEKFILKRSEFTQAIKCQRSDFDFRQQIISFLNIQMSVLESNETKVVDEEVNEEELEEEEIPAEIQRNINYVENLMNGFADEEIELWMNIQSMLEKCYISDSNAKEVDYDSKEDKKEVNCSQKDLIEKMDKYLMDSFAQKKIKKTFLDYFSTNLDSKLTSYLMSLKENGEEIEDGNSNETDEDDEDNELSEDINIDILNVRKYVLNDILRTSEFGEMYDGWIEGLLNFEDQETQFKTIDELIVECKKCNGDKNGYEIENIFAHFCDCCKSLDIAVKVAEKDKTVQLMTR